MNTKEKIAVMQDTPNSSCYAYEDAENAAIINASASHYHAIALPVELKEEQSILANSATMA